MTIFNDLPDLFYLGFYHPRYSYSHNDYSNTILELKEQKNYAINSFIQKLKRFLENEELTIATVPSGKSTRISSGIRELAKQLITLYPSFSDAVFYLERFKDSNDDRTVNNHSRTIKVNNSSAIKDKKVILLDDVLTTGSSIKACKQLLLEAGAKEVKVIVLGKTMRNVDEAHYFVEQKIDEYLAYSLEEVNEKYRYLSNSDQNIDILKEVSFDEHIEVDKWANKQYSYLGINDELEYHLIQEETKKQHEIIDEIYDEKICELMKEIQHEQSKLEYEEDMVYKDCQYFEEEAHQVLDGYTCFYPSNPFIFDFRDW